MPRKGRQIIRWFAIAVLHGGRRLSADGNVDVGDFVIYGNPEVNPCDLREPRLKLRAIPGIINEGSAPAPDISE